MVSWFTGWSSTSGSVLTAWSLLGILSLSLSLALLFSVSLKISKLQKKKKRKESVTVTVTTSSAWRCGRASDSRVYGHPDSQLFAGTKGHLCGTRHMEMNLNNHGNMSKGDHGAWLCDALSPFWPRAKYARISTLRGPSSPPPHCHLDLSARELVSSR